MKYLKYSFFFLVSIIPTGCAILSGNDTTTRILNASEITNIEYIYNRADVTVISGAPNPCYVYSGSEITGNDSIRIIKIFGSEEQPICVGSKGAVFHKQSLWFETPGRKLLRFYRFDGEYLDTLITIH